MASSLPLSPPLVTFWGAAQAVTGSMHLVEAAGQKILLDCGLTRGHHARPASNPFPFDPRALDAVVISHAHVDHCGNLPRLVHQGFAGPIYCTPATRDLLALILGNSARIQEEDAFVHQVIGQPSAAVTQPAFRRPDVDRTVQQCIALAYGEPREIGRGLQLRLADAGHILGSAMVSLSVSEDGRTSRLTFTGDLGRRRSALLRDPDRVPAADLLITECTYGGRALDTPAHAAQELETVVRRTIERGGKVLIPAFSLGRMQVVVHSLEQAIRAGRLPPVPIFVDSSLAAGIAEVYRRHLECLRAEVVSQFEAGADPLGGDGVRYVHASEESRELSLRREPCVILASGGMCEGGRIVHHLKHHIDDPRCSVVLVNYQAPHTPGRQLLERGPTVRFHGKKWNKWADVVYLAGFSGHADHADLLALLGPLAAQNPRVRLVHGEMEQALLLEQALREEGFTEIAIPARGESVPF